MNHPCEICDREVKPGEKWYSIDEFEGSDRGFILEVCRDCFVSVGIEFADDSACTLDEAESRLR